MFLNTTVTSVNLFHKEPDPCAAVLCLPMHSCYNHGSAFIGAVSRVQK